jgi:uncharacterized protein YfaS (alpha-2-macroglobulin family)
VLHTNFSGEIEQQQNLIFQFNKDLFPDGSSDNWDSTAYIEFEPKVPGSFRWSNADELVFSPSAGFAPATAYKATLTSRLLQKTLSKYNYKIGSNKTFNFHTAPLRVTHATSVLTKGKASSNIMQQLDITMNYETDVTQAASKLKLSANGNSVNFNVINGGTGKTISVQFQPINTDDKTVDLKIAIDKGIGIAGSKIFSEKDTSFTTQIISRFVLQATGLNAQHDGVQGTVDISFSQPVSEQEIKNLISIEPKIQFDAVANEDGISIVSKEFDPNTSYNITIKKSLKGEYGGMLKEDYIGRALFGTLDPMISFINSKGMYLSSKGYKNVSLNIVQVDKVLVSVIKVYENNIYQLIKRGKSYGYDDDENSDEYHDYQYYRTENLGDTVFQKIYDTKTLPKNNAASVLHLDFSDKLKGYDGIYVIKIASTNHKWLQDSKILSLSDIGLIAKQDQNKIYVFANSIRNATPISGAKISFISTTNQVATTETTDKDGMAVFEASKGGNADFKIGMVTAKMNDEFSFIGFDQNLIETSRFDVGGRSVNKTGINAWIYAERNLYRPGETIHASVIARDEAWNLPGNLPVKLRLLMPNGKEFSVRRKELNEQGSAEVEFPIPNTALTGTYILQVLSGNDVLLNTYNFSIEDFMPDRIKVDLKLPKTEYSVGETVASFVQADNLFGTPAANRNYDWELNISKTPLLFKEYKDYYFDVTNNLDFKTVLRSGKTGAGGGVAENFEIPNDLVETGLLKGNISATVFDETGRPVHRYAQFDIYTQPVFLGIKQFNDYVGTRVPLRIGLIALDKKGTPQTQDATVTIVRKEWQNVIQESDGRYKYVAQWVAKKVAVKDIFISGANTVFTYTPEISGEYEIHVARAGSESYVSNSFYAYGSGDTQYSSFEVNNEGNVTIKADKETYQPGENINLLFTTPFEGRMLVSVERNKILQYYFLNTDNKSASLKLNVSEDYLPNVYISATLIRPMDESDMPLTVAHGYENIKVESKESKLPVSVSMNDRSRSKTQQTITVKTTPDAYLTIAAVDEGILQVKNYATPNPYDYFYQKIALGVNSYDIYPMLLPEIKTTQSSSGGDGSDESENAGRVNPLFVNRVKNVSFWSGIIQADSRGVATYNIDVPQFSGDIRVMVVAYKNKAFGSFDNHLKVADPIVISTALPRFFSPEDEALMPVILSNTTNKEAAAQISVQTQGAVALPGESSQTINISPNSEGRAVFKINAAQQIGAGKVTVTVKALNETFTNETEISVRPPASLQKQYLSGVVGAGSTAAIGLDNNFIPGTFSGNLVVANTPLVQFSKNLSYLVHYPYGCVEQTTSAAFPQLYYADLVKTLTGKESNDPNPNYNVQQAILKLQSMQLSNGSLSYWPGGNYESWWGTVFATHFLIEAQRAGFEVNQTTVNRLLDYLRFRLKKKETIEYYFNENITKTIVAKEVIYSLYILALVHAPDISLMNYYKGNTNMLSMDEKYLLAATFFLNGQGDKAKQILPPAFTGEVSETQSGGSFYSYQRDKAVALNALLDIDPQNPQVAELARQLSQDMQSNPYFNTQESVWAILALGKIAHATAGANGEAQITANSKIIATVKGQAVNIDLKNLMNQSLQVKATGSTFYYFKEMSGISADGNIKEEDKYLRVRRSYYDRAGREIVSNTFKQNDLIVVKITIEGQFRNEIQNVVITDMLPAGFEIENTRLNDMPNLKWVTDAKEKDEPDYLDVRDDRMNIFTSAGAKPKTFYYMVRAVSPGTYKLGPVQADAMYNGMYHSYNGAGVVKIEE